MTLLGCALAESKHFTDFESASNALEFSSGGLTDSPAQLAFQRILKLFKGENADLTRTRKNITNNLEDTLESELLRVGFNHESEALVMPFKEALQDPLHTVYLPTPKSGNWFCSQPFGSQAYPDFVISQGGVLVPIELKSTSKRSNPLWNGHLITTTGVYLIAEASTPDVTFFLGSDISSVDEKRRALKLEEELRTISLQYQDRQASQYLYFRKAWGDGAAMGKLYDHKDRMMREQRVLSLLGRITA